MEYLNLEIDSVRGHTAFLMRNYVSVKDIKAFLETDAFIALEEECEDIIASSDYDYDNDNKKLFNIIDKKIQANIPFPPPTTADYNIRDYYTLDYDDETLYDNVVCGLVERQPPPSPPPSQSGVLSYYINIYDNTIIGAASSRLAPSKAEKRFFRALQGRHMTLNSTRDFYNAVLVSAKKHFNEKCKLVSPFDTFDHFASRPEYAINVLFSWIAYESSLLSSSSDCKSAIDFVCDDIENYFDASSK
jgi:hypothetical protein